jgi:HCOMODA/2-hydroxy-3-carboxy-muconic semialdehyde decarboxylase
MSDKDARQDVVRVCRVLDQRGLVEGFGHVTVRLPGGNMLITPARGPGLATEDELLVFSPEGELVAGREGTAPLERWMHLAIYRARPDVNAICRTHSRMAAALGVANVPVRPSHGFGGMLGTEVPVHPENDLITSDAMGREVAATLGDRQGVLLRGNGALVTGATLPQACVRAIYLEEAAWMQVVAAGVGGAIPFTPEELAARQRWYDVEVERAWEYYTAKTVPR